MTTIQRDLAALYQLLCGAMANWTVPEPGEPVTTANESTWRHEAQEKERIYVEMHAIFDRYPNLLYVASINGQPANPIAADWEAWTNEQRLEFLEQLPCCRHCGSLDTGCQCWNDE